MNKAKERKNIPSIKEKTNLFFITNWFECYDKIKSLSQLKGILLLS